MSAFRQLVRSGLCKPGLCSTKYRAVNVHTYSGTSRLNYRQFSQLAKPNGDRAFPVDTSALLRTLEAQGIPPKQAGAILEVLNDRLESVAAKMQKTEMMQESNLSKFKSEVKSSQTEKLRGDMEKMRSELRYEPDKATAGQRPELDLEIGRIRDELARLKKRVPHPLGIIMDIVLIQFILKCIFSW